LVCEPVVGIALGEDAAKSSVAVGKAVVRSIGAAVDAVLSK
jgi:hypothetical protein